jgi:hypothetical protein
MGPRQRGLLEPLMNTRLDWAAGMIGRLAERATVEVDDQSVAERLAGLQKWRAVRNARWHSCRLPDGQRHANGHEERCADPGHCRSG